MSSGEWSGVEAGELHEGIEPFSRCATQIRPLHQYVGKQTYFSGNPWWSLAWEGSHMFTGGGGDGDGDGDDMRSGI